MLCKLADVCRRAYMSIDCPVNNPPVTMAKFYVPFGNNRSCQRRCFEVLTTKWKKPTLKYTSNVTVHHRGPKRKLRAGYRAASLKWTSHIAMRFHRRVWYRVLSLRYMCIRSSGIILIPKTIFVQNGLT